MKKFFLVVAALGMLATSCTKDDAAVAGGESLVSFTIDSPELMTRAEDGKGQSTNHLQYAFYDENGVILPALKGEVANFVGSTKINISLVEGREYSALFWADNTAAPYQVSLENKTMEITATEFDGNADKYDAFYKYQTEINPAQKTHHIELTRPFAQINIATADKTKAANAGFDAVATKVTVRAHSTLNLATGVVGNNDYVDYTYTWAALPTSPATATVGSQSYDMLAMNYVLVNGRELVNVKMEVSEEASGAAPIERNYTTVPVQRNYRTYIVGNLLTTTNEFDVTTVPGFSDTEEYVVWDGVTVTEPEVTTDPTTGEEVYTVDSGSDLAWLAGIVNGTITRAGEGDDLAGVTITLAGNIDLGGNQWTPIGVTPDTPFKGTFDGNGFSIKNLHVTEAVAKEGKAYIGFFGYAKDATVKNVTFENVYLNIACLDIDHSQGHIGAVAGSLEGTSTIENVTVKGDVKVEATVTANGASRVAVVAGGNSYGNVTMKNVHVIANEGSYLKANNNVGALAGQLQGVSVFENCSSNIDVTGTKFFAGGIIGLAAGNQTFTNCHTTGDITLTAGRQGKAHDHYRVGGIAGGWADGATKVCTLTDCSYTGALSGRNADGSVAEAFDYAGYVGRGYTLNGCAGSKVVIDGVAYVQVANTASEAGVYTVDGDYEMNTLADMQWLANKVNTGAEYFAGKTVKLANDIDLNNVEWTPIGSAVKDHGFMGNFDGNNKTIKNLNISNIAVDADNYAYAGLFGVTEGTDKDNQNVIKNFTIENVTINTTGHIAAAAIAYPYYTAIENITVAGNVNIKGGDYTSGVLAYTRRCVDAKNLTVAAAEGSVIEGNMTVGGVISDIQMNGGLTANYSNFAASGLTIKGVKSVGGIAGIIGGQSLDGATVKNVAIVCDDTRAGIVIGSCGEPYTLTNVSYENVTGATRVVGATWGSGNYVGQIVEVADVKAVVFDITKNGVKAVSVAEQNLQGKYWQDAMDWAAGLGEGWALASMADLNAIYDLRCELNDALEADNAENALFWEGDELYIKNGSVYYALYMSSDEAVEGELDPQGQAYWPNQVFLKFFNDLGYNDYLYSAVDCINKYAPLRDNYFARGVVTIK